MVSATALNAALVPSLAVDSTGQYPAPVIIYTNPSQLYHMAMNFNAICGCKVRLLLGLSLILLACIAIGVNLNSFAVYDVMGDEAETVLLAKSVLRNGYPRLTDPETYFSNHRGADFGPGGADTHHSWLQHYIAAGAMWLLGTDDFRFLRLPFIALALASAIVTVLMVAETAGCGWWLSVASVCLVFSRGPFLKEVFKIRYFSPAVLFTALVVWGWGRYQRQRTRWVLLFIGGVGLFHSQFPQALPLLTVLVLGSLVAALAGGGRGELRSWRFWKPWVLMAAFILPYLYIFHPFGRHELVASRWDMLAQLLPRGRSARIDRFFPFAHILVPAVTAAALSTNLRRNSRIIVLLVAFAAIAVSATQGVAWLRIRYLLLLGPLYAVFLAFTLKVLTPERNTALLILIALAIAYNIAYWRTPPYRPSRTKQGINWLNENAAPGDTIYVNFDRREVMLHTDLCVTNRSDFQAWEVARVLDPLALDQDPTCRPLEETKWIYWNRFTDDNARKKRGWLNPDYVTVEKIPSCFRQEYRNSWVVIYKNNSAK